MLKALLAAILFFGLATPMGARADFDRNDGFENSPIEASSIGRRKAQQLVTLMYRAILFRNPEPGGLQNWTNLILQNGEQGVFQAAYEIAESNEFRQNIAPRYSVRDIVTNYYRVFLGRAPDREGLRNWISLQRQGQYGEVAQGFVGSQEFRSRYGF